MTNDTDTKIAALAKHLDVSPDDLEAFGFEIEHGQASYLVLTDEEADEKAREQIADSLWAFRASFILAHSRVPNMAEKHLEKMQADMCEGANEIVRGLIEDFDHFVDDAIKADGRGHFLATYDGNEDEITHNGETFYVYRCN